MMNHNNIPGCLAGESLKPWRLTLVFSVLICLAPAATGKPKALINVSHKPEIELAVGERIAIAEIEGRCGEEVRNILTSALVQRGNLSLVNRENIRSILREHNFSQGGFVNTQSAAEAGKLLGASVLIFGRVNVCKTDRKSYKTGRAVSANVETALQLVSLEKGEIVSANIYRGYWRETTHTSTYPDSDLVRSRAFQALGERFSRIFSHWQETHSIALFEGKEGGLGASADLIRLGECEDASVRLGKASTIARSSAQIKLKSLAKIYHNLGVALMCMGKASDARGVLDKSYRLVQSQPTREAIQVCGKILATRGR